MASNKTLNKERTVKLLHNAVSGDPFQHPATFD
jgi:hypothetical protein